MKETDVPQSSALGADLTTHSFRQGPPGGVAPPPMSSSSSGSSRGMGGIMNTINSAIELVKSPVNYITAHKDDPATVNDIMLKYVAVLALIPFFAILIGDLWYYSIFSLFRFVGGAFIGYAFAHAILEYILSVISVYVVAVVIKALAPSFNSSVDQIKSLKLSAYIATPAFLIGALNIIPPLGVLTFLGFLYGLYILYLGLPIVLGTPKDKVVIYVIAILVATLIVYVVVYVIIGLITAAIFLTSLGFGFL